MKRPLRLIFLILLIKIITTEAIMTQRLTWRRLIKVTIVNDEQNHATFQS
jgi:hypothetical protein